MLSKRSQRKVDSIVEQASLLFVRHGFHKVTMEGIAQYANVSKVTLYKYFKDKQALYEHIIIEQCDVEYDVIKDIVTDLIPYSEKVHKMVRYHVDTMLDRAKPNLDPDIILTIETGKFVKNHKAKMKRLRAKLYNQARMEEHLPEETSDAVLEVLFHVLIDGLVAQERRLTRLSEDEINQLYHTLLTSVITPPSNG